MSSNQALLKADMALADLANGGLLEPEQSASFIRKLIKTPTILKMCRVVEMAAPTKNINKISFGQRILRKAFSGTALNANAQVTNGLGGRAKPTTEQIQLNTKEILAEVHLPYDVIEDNIEGGSTGISPGSENGPNSGNPVSGGLRDTLVTLIAERAALDLEELGLLGSTAYINAADPDDQDYLSLANGFITRGIASGNVVNASGATVTKAIFKAGMKAIPDQYLRNVEAMKHLVSTNQLTEYRDTLADRVGALGDANVTGLQPAYAYGAEVKNVPLMPQTTGLFSNPLNFIMGIQRKINMEFDKFIASRTYQIVLTCRIDFQVEEALAMAVYTNLGT